MISDWHKLFEIIEKKDYSLSLKEFLNDEYKNYVCFPPRNLLLNAFANTNPNTLKVVIIGQDPYHEKGQAMGLSFSVPNGVPLPPSLQNIYKEIEKEFNIKMKNNGDLTYLAQQGVLLLNAYLSVREGLALSHKRIEYDYFLNDVLNYLDSLPQPIVFLLWGNFAQKFSKNIANPKHIIMKSVHPSPLSANRGGWFGNNNFILTNQYLLSHGIVPIDWKN